MAAAAPPGGGGYAEVVVRSWNIGRVSLHDSRVQTVLSTWTSKSVVDVFVLCEVKHRDAMVLRDSPPCNYTCFAGVNVYGWTTVVGVKKSWSRFTCEWPNNRIALVQLFNSKMTAQTTPTARVVCVHGYRPQRPNAYRGAWFVCLYNLLLKQKRTIVIGDYNHDFRKEPHVTKCEHAESILAAPYNMRRVQFPLPTYENHKTNTKTWHGGDFVAESDGDANVDVDVDGDIEIDDESTEDENDVGTVDLGCSRRNRRDRRDRGSSSSGGGSSSGSGSGSGTGTGTGTAKDHHRTPPETLFLDHIFTSTDVVVTNPVQSSEACFSDLDHRWIGATCTVGKRTPVAAAASASASASASAANASAASASEPAGGRAFAYATLYPNGAGVVVRAYKRMAWTTHRCAFAAKASAAEMQAATMVLGPERGAVLASVLDGLRVFVPVATAPRWCAVFGEDFASQLNPVAVPSDWNIEHAYPTPEDVAAPSTKVFSAALLGYTASVTIAAGGSGGGGGAASVSALASAAPAHEPAICLSESMVAALETLAEQRAQAAVSRIDADVQERTRRLVKQLEEEAEKEKQSVRERELMPLHTLRARKRARVEIVEIE